jgi:hypothetical protein
MASPFAATSPGRWLPACGAGQLWNLKNEKARDARTSAGLIAQRERTSLACTQGSRLRLVREIPLRVVARDAIADYRQRQQLWVARARVRCVAGEHGHALGQWHPDPDRDDRDLVACLRCGAGAAITRDTLSRESMSGELQQACRARGVKGVLLP